MKITVGKRSYVAVAAVLVAGCVGCNKFSHNFTKLTIEPNLHAVMSGTLFGEPADGDYYYYQADPKAPTINHFLKKHGDLSRVLFVELDPNQTLVRSTKHDVIMYDVAYGYVYSDKVCFYGQGAGTNQSSVEVGSFFNTLEEDVPATLSGPPANLPPMTSISYVRMFHPDPEYIVVSANYEADGTIGSLHVDKSKKGVWDSGTDDTIPQDHSPEGMKAAGLAPDLLTKYGIPEKIDVPAFLATKKMELMETKITMGRVALFVHYGWDKYIQQIEIAHGDATETTWYQPNRGADEDAMSVLCDAKLEAQQKAGIATVR